MRNVLYILGELDDADVEWLGSVGRVERYGAGAVVIHAGVTPPSLFIVLQGAVEVMVPPPMPRIHLLAGEVLGEISFLDRRPPSVAVRTSEPTRLLAVPSQVISKRLEADLAFAARFYRALGVYLASRLRRVSVAPEDELDPSVEAEGELDLEQLDDVARASSRFVWLLARLAGGA